jgi:hypothetical protein
VKVYISIRLRLASNLKPKKWWFNKPLLSSLSKSRSARIAERDFYFNKIPVKPPVKDISIFKIISPFYINKTPLFLLIIKLPVIGTF